MDKQFICLSLSNKTNLKVEIMQNTFIPYPPNIARCIKFWKTEKQTPAKDKAGSFNLGLYLEYKRIVSQGICEPIKLKDHANI